MKKNYLIDIDGTVTDDVPNENWELMKTCKPKIKAVEKINALYDEGHTITFFTSRTDSLRVLTLDWLYKWGFKFHNLITEKPRGGNYVWIDNLDVEYVKFTEELWSSDLEITQKFKMGQIVKQNNQMCSIVGLPGSSIPGGTVPDGHLALWYGEVSGMLNVYTVPADYVEIISEEWNVIH